MKFPYKTPSTNSQSSKMISEAEQFNKFKPQKIH